MSHLRRYEVCLLSLRGERPRCPAQVVHLWQPCRLPAGDRQLPHMPRLLRLRRLSMALVDNRGRWRREARRQEVLRLRQEGIPIEEIIKRTGYSRKQIYNIRQNMGSI